MQYTKPIDVNMLLKNHEIHKKCNYNFKNVKTDIWENILEIRFGAEISKLLTGWQLKKIVELFSSNSKICDKS